MHWTGHAALTAPTAAAVACLLACASPPPTVAASVYDSLAGAYSLRETRAGNLCLGRLTLGADGVAAYTSPCVDAARGAWKATEGGGLAWTLQYDRSTVLYTVLSDGIGDGAATGEVIAVPRAAAAGRDASPRRVGSFQLQREP